MLEEKIISNEEQTIKKEYYKLNERWMNLQYQANLWMVLFVVAVEIAIFMVWYGTELIRIPAIPYIVKFIVVPLAMNLCLLFTAHSAIKCKKCNHDTKIYVVTLVFSGCCVVVYMVHYIFPALYLIFAIPMIMTIVYANRRLTMIISLICIFEKAIADLFINWDDHKTSVFATPLSQADFFISFAVLMVIMGACYVQAIIEHDRSNVSIELIRERIELQKQVMTDSLTGVGNRHALRQALDLMLAEREKKYSLAMVDLDSFKQLNDTKGHGIGDQYLSTLGSVLLAKSNHKISAFRFGGDEFCLLFRNIEIQECEKICDNICREYIEKQKHIFDKWEVTLSIGLAAYREVENQPGDLLECADAALYYAKKERNRICIFNESMEIKKNKKIG